MRSGIGRDSSVPGAGHGRARNATGCRSPRSDEKESDADVFVETDADGVMAIGFD